MASNDEKELRTIENDENFARTVWIEENDTAEIVQKI
jgi:hypothetical protein